MRVVMVIPGSEQGSSMIFAKRQADYLRHHLGVDVHLFYLDTRVSIRALIRQFIRLRQAVRRIDPDCVHAQYGTITGLLTRLSTARPFVITFRGSDLNPCLDISVYRSRLGHFLSQIAALTASSIICVSHRLRSKLWWSANRAQVIPSGVNTDEFLPTPLQEARRRLGWNPDEKVALINVGGVPKTKRLDLATAAFETVRTLTNQPCRLVVLDGSTHWSTMPTIVSASDCVLVTSAYEGAPSIIQEALACNTPIVTVDVGDAPLLVAGVCGCHVVERQPAAIAEAVLSTWNSGRLPHGRERAEATSLRDSCARTAACYAIAVGDRRHLLSI